LAKELAGDHITVNTIALVSFPGEARDIVGLTQFLTSSASSYITGATIPLDGGMHM